MDPRIQVAGAPRRQPRLAAMPLLAHAWFRQAVAYAIDREAGIDAAFAGSSPVLGRRPGGARQPRPPEPARRVSCRISTATDTRRQPFRRSCWTTAASWAGDGIWSCGGTRAPFGSRRRLGTGSGRPSRTPSSPQRGAAGIELEPNNSRCWDLFGGRLPARDFDLIMFSWQMSRDPFVRRRERKVRCGGELRTTCGFARRKVDARPRRRRHRDRRRQGEAACSTRWTTSSPEDVPSLPLFQRPTFLAYRPGIVGLVNNVGPQGIACGTSRSGGFPARRSASRTARAGERRHRQRRTASCSSRSAARRRTRSRSRAGRSHPAWRSSQRGAPRDADDARHVRLRRQRRHAAGRPTRRAASRSRSARPSRSRQRGLMSATVGVPYAATLDATGAGGHVTGWSISAGSLPAGLTLGAAAAPPTRRSPALPPRPVRPRSP